MPRGRQTRRLTRSQIARLEAFRRARHDGAPSGYSLPQLRSAMALGCSWETLQKALQGLPVWYLHNFAIVQWIDRYLEPETPVRSGKDAAAGEREPEESPERGEDGETGEATRTVRGSR